MKEIQPKDFQTDALEALRRFLSDARLRSDPAVAFMRMTNGLYRPLPGMPEVPAVCLRLPTGGGKTMLAAMSIGVAADTYLERDYPLVLWLVPTDAIRRQTLRALSDTDHPYRKAIAKRFGTAVQVLETSSFAQLTPQDVATRCTILVGTMQSLQVTNTEGRRVYAHNENLEAFFATGAAREMPGLEKHERDGPKFSFANLLKVQRPLVILDEAHRFVTPLAQEVRQRIGAGVVVELTATPDRDANILYSAKASQLKDNGMIKLPVLLTEHRSNWEQAVTAAVHQRRYLAEVAASEPRYIRPMLLIQAQNADETATWQVIRQHLLETEEMPLEEIAVVTGGVDELGDTDLLSPRCRITTILTVQALAEGWDCSFAYVLCSVANLGSARAVEQMVGRVLRMPGAEPCVAGVLNQAYVHASSKEFGDTAKSLRDGLVKSGFDEAEARDAVRSTERALPLMETRVEFRVTVPSPPNLSELDAEQAAEVRLEENAYGSTEVFVQGVIPPSVRREVLRSLPEASRAAVERRMDEHDRPLLPTPAERGERFAVPGLAVEIGGEWLPFDADTLEEQAGVDILRYPFDVSLFAFDETTRTYSFDLFGELLQVSWVAARDAQPMSLKREVTQAGLVRWLVNRLHDTRVNDDVLCAWVDDALTRLQQRSLITLAVLDQGRYILERLLEAAKSAAWAAERSLAYQAILFAPGAHPATTSEFAFQFSQEYPAKWFCERTVFTKHFYDKPGELEEEGQEYSCAVEIDHWDQTGMWVRNLSRRERTSFSLQTASDRFYPDFVVKLVDGRVLAVEYKGKQLESADDARTKSRLGQLWADRSSDTALFAMVTVTPGGKSIRQQLEEALSGSKSIFARQQP